METKNEGDVVEEQKNNKVPSFSSSSASSSSFSFKVILLRHGLRIDEESRDYDQWKSKNIYWPPRQLPLNSHNLQDKIINTNKNRNIEVDRDIETDIDNHMKEEKEEGQEEVQQELQSGPKNEAKFQRIEINPWDPPLSKEGEEMIRKYLPQSFLSSFQEYNNNDDDDKKNDKNSSSNNKNSSNSGSSKKSGKITNPWKIGKIYTSPFLRCLETSFLLSSLLSCETQSLEGGFITATGKYKHTPDNDTNNDKKIKNLTKNMISMSAIPIVTHFHLHEYLTETNLNQGLCSTFRYVDHPNIHEWFYRKYSSSSFNNKTKAKAAATESSLGNLPRYYSHDYKQVKDTTQKETGQEQEQRKERQEEEKEKPIEKESTNQLEKASPIYDIYNKTMPRIEEIGRFNSFPESLFNCQQRFISTFYQILEEHSHTILQVSQSLTLQESSRHAQNNNEDISKHVDSATNHYHRHTDCDDNNNNSNNNHNNNNNYDQQNDESNPNLNLLICTHGIGVKIILEEVLRNRNKRILESYRKRKEEEEEASVGESIEPGFFLVKKVDCNGYVIVDVHLTSPSLSLPLSLAKEKSQEQQEKEEKNEKEEEKEEKIEKDIVLSLSSFLQPKEKEKEKQKEKEKENEGKRREEIEKEEQKEKDQEKEGKRSEEIYLHLTTEPLASEGITYFDLPPKVVNRKGRAKERIKKNGKAKEKSKVNSKRERPRAKL